MCIRSSRPSLRSRAHTACIYHSSVDLFRWSTALHRTDQCTLPRNGRQSRWSTFLLGNPHTANLTRAPSRCCRACPHYTNHHSCPRIHTFQSSWWNRMSPRGSQCIAHRQSSFAGRSSALCCTTRCTSVDLALPQIFLRRTNRTQSLRSHAQWHSQLDILYTAHPHKVQTANSSVLCCIPQCKRALRLFYPAQDQTCPDHTMSNLRRQR